MKKILLVAAVVMLVSSFAAPARAAVDVNTLFGQLKDQLLKSGLSAADVSATASPVKSMLGLGAGSADIKNILLNLASQGFKGMDLGNLTALVSNLMQNGQAIQNAWGLVSQAIQQAKIGGLSGSDLVLKVQQVIGANIAKLNQLKSAAQSAVPQAAASTSADTSASGITKSIGSLLGK